MFTEGDIKGRSQQTLPCCHSSFHAHPICYHPPTLHQIMAIPEKVQTQTEEKVWNCFIF